MPEVAERARIRAELIAAAVVARWTRSLGEKFGVAATLDVTSREGVRYRVFFLGSSLQVDLSFWPRELFRATEDGFQLVFGQANPNRRAPRLR